MCRISYEKCVCFVFLVILAVLSCSGFRIDNLAMTDISKRNSHTSSSLLNSDDPLGHRIRHHRQLRAQARPPIPNHFAPPTASLLPKSGDQKRKQKQSVCPEYDLSWKAYKADAIVRAKVESISSMCKEICTVFFKVKETIKNSSFSVDERLRLKFFSIDKRSNSCEYDDLTTDRSQSLVRAKIDESKEYILFLNTYGAHNFSAVFVPEVSRKKKIGIVLKVASPNFRPRSVWVENPSQKGGLSSKRLRLVCKVRGFPIPIIYWKRNNTLLHPNSRQRITQKKRKSTLVIRNFSKADLGRYECVARGVDGRETSHTFQSISRTGERPNKRPNGRTTEKPDSGISLYRKPCKEPYKSDWCFNGGTCFHIELLNEYLCECSEDYTGLQCDQKVSDQSSMYRQTPIYTCKIGLYTKYDNC